MAFSNRAGVVKVPSNLVSTNASTKRVGAARNPTRQPGASVPCGLTQDGRPVGLQIIGPRHRDLLVLQASYAFEKAAPWDALRPPVA